MNITATENALNFLEWHPEFNLPLTASECFAGMTTSDDLKTPDLTVGIAYMHQLLTQIKDDLRNQIKDISPKNSCLLPSTMSLHYIVDNIDITLITENDNTSGTAIPVRNLFKYQITQNDERSYEVVLPPSPDDNSKDNLLGVYLKRTGSIMLWIDKILQKDNPELFFQKVLLHEMIHALLDIYPRVYFKYSNGMCTILTGMGKKNTTVSEETIDNFLVLDCYSHTRKEYYDIVKEFIKKQPSEYKAAIDIYDPKNKDYTIIRAHLEEKVSNRERFDISQSINYINYIVSLTDDEEEYDDEEDLISLFESGIYDVLGSIRCPYEEYKESSNGILWERVLLNKCLPYFRSPWIMYGLNLLTKEISLRIGDILFYRLNPINTVEECFDLLNHKKIKDNTGLDFEISGDASELIYKLIGCINPDSTFTYASFIPNSQWDSE